MWRTKSITLAWAVIGFTFPALGQTVATSIGDRSLSLRAGAGGGSSIASHSARQLLRKRVASLDWVDKTFEEVLAWLRDQGEDDVNIVAKWVAMGVEAVDQESLVSLRIKNVTVREVLDAVLEQISEEGQITYHGWENVLTISTREDFARKLETRVYLITDLIFQAPDMGRSFPAVDLDAASRSGGGGGGGGSGGQSIFGGQGGGSGSEDLEEEEAEVKERVDNLVDLILSHVAPPSWNRAPGGQPGSGAGPGSIGQYNNRALVVTNTAEVHEQIAGFFAFE